MGKSECMRRKKEDEEGGLIYVRWADISASGNVRALHASALNKNIDLTASGQRTPRSGYLNKGR